MSVPMDESEGGSGCVEPPDSLKSEKIIDVVMEKEKTKKSRAMLWGGRDGLF